MNPKHLHTPVSNRLRCPVCHQAVYSRGGIHPQCAMRQSEPPLPKLEPLAGGSPDDSAAGSMDGVLPGAVVKARPPVKAPKFKIAMGAEKAGRVKSSI